MALALPSSVLTTAQHVRARYLGRWIRLQDYLLEAFYSGSF
jgi:hypothetical protein